MGYSVRTCIFRFNMSDLAGDSAADQPVKSAATERRIADMIALRGCVHAFVVSYSRIPLKYIHRDLSEILH